MKKLIAIRDVTESRNLTDCGGILFQTVLVMWLGKVLIEWAFNELKWEYA